MTPKHGQDRGDAPAAALVQRIQELRGHMSTRQRALGAEALAHRLTFRRRRMSLSVRSALALGLLAGVALFAVKLGLERYRPRALSYAIDNGRVEGGGYIQADSASQPRLRFSDGSEVLFRAGTKASLRSVDGHGARVSLAQGAAHVDVVHAPAGRWLFEAGPFVINVTGTAFTVAWKPSDEQLDVQMERGSVEVNSPLSDAPMLLRSGQHLVVRVRQRETMIRNWEEEASPPGVPAALLPTDRDPAPVAGLRAPVDAKRGPSLPARTGQANENRDWATQLAKGNFEGIVGQAQAIGLETCLAESSSGDLAALADAARYGRHDDIARRALLAERRRFPLSTPAQDASFLLGRLEETEQRFSGAIEWYDRYLAESPRGTYASEALGRKMNLVERVQGDERARYVAAEYLTRFPRGTYAARARALTAAP
jgi:hypothetical protein